MGITMGNHANECFCLKCNLKRRVGRDAKTEIVDDECYVYCSICESELYNYKINVQKKRDIKADHKSHTTKG